MYVLFVRHFDRISIEATFTNISAITHDIECKVFHIAEERKTCVLQLEVVDKGPSDKREVEKEV